MDENILSYSIYLRYANTELNWLPMDTEELFNRHLETRYDELKRWGWLDRKFTYKFNSHGFRCDEFTDSPTLMALGCSHTAGIGLPIDTIWPSLLSNKLNLKCANLGQGGGSPATAFRLCYYYIDKIKPSVVAYMEPPPGRFELLHYEKNNKLTCTDFSVNRLLENGESKIINESMPYYQYYIAHDINWQLDYLKSKLAIQQLCSQRNIKFIEVKFPDLCINNARDLGHFGRETHYLAAENAVNCI